MKKITGLLSEIKMIDGRSYTAIKEGVPHPITIKRIIIDSVETYAFPTKATAKDLKEMSKMLSIGETLYNSNKNELLIEDEDLEILKNVINAPQQTKVAPVVVHVLKVLDDAEKIKVQETPEKGSKTAP